jgi:RNA polymerase sigma-70 factor (ECF subfamily)
MLGVAIHARRNGAGLRPIDAIPVSTTDHEPFGRALLGHAAALYGYALHLTRRPADAEELVQESYVRALAGATSFVGGNLKAWLFQILRNTYIDLHHRGRPQPALVEPAALDDIDERDLFHDDLELDRLRRAVAADLEAALAKLSEESRSIILLDLEGFTETEVAGVVGCAVGTVKSRLARARALLRKKLKDYAR